MQTQVDQGMKTELSETTSALRILVHDLCSPLQSLIASNESLVLEALGEEGRQAVARIRRATQLLSAQVDDLSALARVQAGDMSSHDISFEVGALLQDLATMGHSGLTVVAPGAPVFARGDAALMLQVLDRLVRTVLAASQAPATLAVEIDQLNGESLSFCLQCADRPVLQTKFAQRLILVRVFAAALKGDLETVLKDPAGLMLILRVAVQFEDPNTLAT